MIVKEFGNNILSIGNYVLLFESFALPDFNKYHEESYLILIYLIS